jgi:hypothetical protein
MYKLKGGAARENPNLTSGSCSAQKDAKVTNFNVVMPIDHTTAIVTLKNNKPLYYMFLTRFRNSNLMAIMN